MQTNCSNCNGTGWFSDTYNFCGNCRGSGVGSHNHSSTITEIRPPYNTTISTKSITSTDCFQSLCSNDYAQMYQASCASLSAQDVRRCQTITNNPENSMGTTIACSNVVSNTETKNNSLLSYNIRKTDQGPTHLLAEQVSNLDATAPTEPLNRVLSQTKCDYKSDPQATHQPVVCLHITCSEANVNQYYQTTDHNHGNIMASRERATTLPVDASDISIRQEQPEDPMPNTGTNIQYMLPKCGSAKQVTDQYATDHSTVVDRGQLYERECYDSVHESIEDLAVYDHYIYHPSSDTLTRDERYYHESDGFNCQVTVQ